MGKPREFFGKKIKKIVKKFFNFFFTKFDLLKPKIKNFNFQNLNGAYFLLSNFNFWCKYFSKHFLKPKF